jgi:SAM-dependent methyltransferase
VHKGWFKIAGVQDGDRTLEQQMLGLAPALEDVKGRTVLDLGCAEGLVGREFLKAGASDYFGIEIVTANAEEARRQLSDFEQAVIANDNLDHHIAVNGVPAAKYNADIVLSLAILHKLRDPARAIRFIGEVTTIRAVIRTAERTPGYVQDVRSGDKRFEIVGPLKEAGLVLDRVETGPFNEWTGHFVRR